MQRALIAPLGNTVCIFGELSPSQDVRLEFYAAAGDADVRLIVELRAPWSQQLSADKKVLKLSGTLNIEAADATPCTIKVGANNELLQLQQLKIGGTDIINNTIDLRDLKEGKTDTASVNAGATKVAHGLIDLRVDTQTVGGDRFKEASSKIDVMFAAMPTSTPPHAGDPQPPLMLLVVRTFGWRTGFGGGTSKQYGLMPPGGGKQPIVLYDFAWRTANQEPYRFAIAQFTERVAKNTYSRKLVLLGLTGLGIQAYWNRVIASRQYAKTSQRLTTLPTYEVAENSTPDTSQANFGRWALVFRRSDTSPNWTPASLVGMSHLPIKVLLRQLPQHDGTGLTLWTKMYPLAPDAQFPETDAEANTPIPKDGGSAPSIALAQKWLVTFAQLTEQFVLDAEGFDNGSPAATLGHEQRLRVGALDTLVDVAGKSVPLRATLRASSAPGTFLDPELSRFTHDVKISLSDVYPGGQDELPLYTVPVGASADDTDRKFTAKPPMVVPLRQTTAVKDLWLELNEGPAQADDAWQLALKVHAPAAAEGEAKNAFCAVDGPRKDQVVVLDAAPMLVALVEYPFFLTNPLDGAGDTVAIWTRDSRVWKTQSAVTANEACVVLPAQATGEDMEKEGTLTATKNQRVSYRLGRPARLQLTLGNGAGTNFTEAPWNIHRLFRDTNIGLNAEPRLKSLQFELLYGLSCTLTPTPAAIHRIADITRRLGTVPTNLRQHAPWEGNALQAHVSAYSDARKNWAAIFEQYQSRLLVLEPFPDAARYALDPVVTPPGMLSCTILKPSTIDAADPIGVPDPSKLFGGALWGLESQNVYNMVLQDPNSVDALLSGGGFTALGGYGNIESSFDQGNTKIIARVEMGRVAEYTVERKGRIAVLWNKCKHVIVYRRSVLPSEQFEPFQPDLDGRAIIRKYAEYIELEEDARRFLSNDGGNAPEIGFVSGSIFPKGSRINVRSAWGGDVGRIGYRIPLWNPSAAAAQPNVYPKPVVGLTLIRAGRDHPAGGAVAATGATESADITCTVDEPQNLQFFSYTVANAGSNTDTWPAVEGVDYIALPTPLPATIPGGATNTEHVTSMVPPDSRVPAGFERVTFKVQPTDATVNLVAGRQPAGATTSVSTRIDTVTMMRGPFLPPAPIGDADTAAREALAAVAAQIDSAHLAIQDIVKRLADDKNAGAQVLAYLDGSQPLPPGQVGVEIGAARDRYAAALKAASAASAKVIAQRAVRMTEVSTAKVDALYKSLSSAKNKAYLDAIKALTDELEGVRNQLRALSQKTDFEKYVDALAEAYLERLLHLDAIADPLSQDVARLIVAAKALHDRWLTAVNEALALLSDAGNRAQLERWLDRWEGYIDETTRQLASARPEWLVIAPALLAGALDPYTQALTAVRAQAKDWNTSLIQQALTAVEAKAAQQLANIGSALCPAPDASIKDPTLRLLACSGAGAEIMAVRNKLRTIISQNPVAQLPGLIYTQLTADLATLAGASAVASILADTQQQARQAYQRLQQQAALAEQTIVKQFNEQKAAIEDELKRQAQATAAEARAAVDDLRRRATSAAEGIAESVIRDLRPIITLGDVATVTSTADKAIKLARAFGDPPDLSQLGFSREKLGFFYKEADKIGITPVVARVMQVGNALKAAGLDLPVEGLRDALVPAALKQFKLNDVFSDFASLKLRALFNAIPFPAGMEQRIKVSHKVTNGRASLEAHIDDVEVSGSASIFSIGPLELLLDEARFNAKISVSSTLAGDKTQEVTGSLAGKWSLKVGGTTMITFNKTELAFASPGSLKFKVDPANVQLADALQFVTKLLEKLNPGDLNGLHVSLTATGVESVLESALAPIQMGTTAISNLRIGARFAVSFAPSFAIEMGGFLAKRDAPFALTIFVLGGGGFLDVRSRYEITTGKLSCSAGLGISAAASVGIALGPIRGGVFVSLGFAVDYSSSGENSGLRISVIFVIRGEVSVLGLIDVCLTLYLELSYDGNTGKLQGTGIVSLRIKICWCFTLKVKAQVTYTLGCDPSSTGHHVLAAPRISPADIERIARDYVTMLA